MSRERVFYAVLTAAIVGGLAVGLTADPKLFADAGSMFGKKASSTEAVIPPPRGGLWYNIDTKTGNRTGGEFDGWRIMRRRDDPQRACALPEARPEEKIFLFGAYDAATTSSVAVTELDDMTQVAEVEIQPGEQPIYLVLSSFQPMVWRFSGAVHRVSRVALVAFDISTNGVPAAGAVGLPGDKVMPVYMAGCFDRFFAPKSPEGLAAAAVVTQRLGRAPDVVGGRRRIGYLQVPSGMAAEPWPPSAPAGFDKTVWRQATADSPGGVAIIAPGEVRGGVAAQSYPVLPSLFGVSKLVGAGDLTRVAKGYRIERYFPDLPIARDEVNFYLPANVPSPRFVGGCLRDDATQKPMQGLCSHDPSKIVFKPARPDTR